MVIGLYFSIFAFLIWFILLLLIYKIIKRFPQGEKDIEDAVKRVNKIINDPDFSIKLDEDFSKIMSFSPVFLTSINWIIIAFSILSGIINIVLFSVNDNVKFSFAILYLIGFFVFGMLYVHPKIGEALILRGSGIVKVSNTLNTREIKGNVYYIYPEWFIDSVPYFFESKIRWFEIIAILPLFWQLPHYFEIYLDFTPGLIFLVSFYLELYFIETLFFYMIRKHNIIEKQQKFLDKIKNTLCTT